MLYIPYERLKSWAGPILADFRSLADSEIVDRFDLSPPDRGPICDLSYIANVILLQIHVRIYDTYQTHLNILADILMLVVVGRANKITNRYEYRGYTCDVINRGSHLL